MSFKIVYLIRRIIFKYKTIGGALFVQDIFGKTGMGEVNEDAFK